MTKQYGFIGHGTMLYMTGAEADGVYCHEITTLHAEGEDWETIAFVPGDEVTARVLGAAYDMRDAIDKIDGKLSELAEANSDDAEMDIVADIQDIVDRARNVTHATPRFERSKP